MPLSLAVFDEKPTHFESDSANNNVFIRFIRFI